MSWLQKLLPPKIQRGTGPRKQVPEGLWTKCPACSAVLYSTDLENNQQVCPKCSHHLRIRARHRLDLLLDPEGRYEIGGEVAPVDALKFTKIALPNPPPSAPGARRDPRAASITDIV